MSNLSLNKKQLLPQHLSCEAYIFTHCLLLVEIHSLFVTRCKITRYSFQNSPVTPLQNSPVTPLQRLLVAKIHSLLVAEVVRCKKSLVAEVVRCKKLLVTRCKIRSLLLVEVAHCKIQLLLVATNHLLLNAKK